MPPLAASGPNAEQIQYWNEASGEKWVAAQESIDRQIEPLGLAALERARVGEGERVVDVGCGCGQTTLELARRVGTGGSVTGLDLSAPMLARARERAQSQGLSNLAFEQADVQTHKFEQLADLIFSRFGVMFFADPIAAFANLAAGLKPAGRLTFVCWQAARENPWVSVPLQAVADLVELPTPTPGAPGPFSLADAARVEDILAQAGFSDIAVEALERDLAVGGGSLEGAVEFLQKIGPSGRALAEADAATRARAADALRRAIEPFAVDGSVRMGSASWIVSARRP